jgi:hypothetical protein
LNKPVLYVVLFSASALFFVGCAKVSGVTLRIDARNVEGIQHIPDELTSMLGELGYGWTPVFDPNSNRGVKTVQKDGEYRMRFEFLETRRVYIDVRIRQKDGVTWLHFHETGSQTLSPSSIDLLNELEDRAVLEFGAANISQ